MVRLKPDPTYERFHVRLKPDPSVERFTDR